MSPTKPSTVRRSLRRPKTPTKHAQALAAYRVTRQAKTAVGVKKYLDVKAEEVREAWGAEYVLTSESDSTGSASEPDSQGLGSFVVSDDDEESNSDKESETNEDEEEEEY